VIKSLDTGKGRIFFISLPRSSPVTKTYNPPPVNTYQGAMMEVDTIEQLKQKYPDEWIIVEVLEEDEKGNILDSRLVTHTKDKEEVLRINKEYKGYIYTFYTGEIPRKGHALAM